MATKLYILEAWFVSGIQL